MNITPFGKKVRTHRIEAEIKLKDMAEALGVSSAYLSAIETGKKKLTDSFVESVISFFTTKDIDATDLRDAAVESRNEINVNLSNANHETKQLVASFARKFSNLSDKQKVEIKKILGD